MFIFFFDNVKIKEKKKEEKSFEVLSHLDVSYNFTLRHS